MKRIAIIATLVASFIGLAVSPASADHSWNGWHWASTSSERTIQVDNNLTGAWQPALNTSVSDWNASPYINLVPAASSQKGKTCKPTAGRIEACNAKYGNNGWLGLATVWVDGNGHITQATVKLNDTYFNSSSYNTPAWRNLVMCQELAHDFGLDHQDEGFGNANLNTCMDYTNDPTSNQHPNAHDYEEIAELYGHTDTYTSSTATKGANGDTVYTHVFHA